MPPGSVYRHVPVKSKLWHEELQEELQRRDTKCSLLGNKEVYHIGFDAHEKYHPKSKYYRAYEERQRKEGKPIKGPVQLFLKENPFHNDPRLNISHCKSALVASNHMDKAKRFYTDIRNKAQCNGKKYGIWDASAIHRGNKLSKGMCWTGEDDRQCGALVSGEVLRDEVTTNAAEKVCSVNPKCKWNPKTRDCFSKRTLQRIRPIVKDPPNDMPADADMGLEDYLYNWYSHSKPGPAPATTPLSGEGNRCAVQEVSSSRSNASNTDDDVLEFEADQPKPSIVQSVINMVIKNVSKNPDASTRGILAWHSTGSGKCFMKDTPILMHDGHVRMVQDVQVGDLVMGDDATPRLVLSLGKGLDQMYDIIQDTGEKYTVNSEHVLCLQQPAVRALKHKHHHIVAYIQGHSIHSQSFQTSEDACAFLGVCANMPDDISNQVAHIEVKDFLRLPTVVQQQFRGYRAASLEFTSKSTLFDPYVIGLWLGEGDTVEDQPALYLSKDSMTSYLYKVLPDYNLTLEHRGKNNYAIVSTGSTNALMSALHVYGLVGVTKFIPDAYKTNNKVEREALLDGLIDSCGVRLGSNIEFVLQSKLLATDIAFVARTLGYTAHVTRESRACTHNGRRVTGEYYHLVLNKTCPLLTKITVRPNEQTREYFGFTLDGNHRFLLGDLTVTHNTCTAAGAFDAVWDEYVIRTLPDGRRVRLRRDIIFATSLDALSSNPPYKFAECALRLYPRFAGEKPGPSGFDCKPDSTKVWAQGCSKTETMFEQRGVRFYSFARLSRRVKKTEAYKARGEYPLWYQSAIIDDAGQDGGAAAKKAPAAAAKKALAAAAKKAPAAATRKKKVVDEDDDDVIYDDDESDFDAPKPARGRKGPAKVSFIKIAADDWIDLDNAILVIDEVHNLFRPLPQQKKEHAYLESELLDPRKHPGLKVVILTATPGDNITDTMKLLNIIRPLNKVNPIKPPNIQNTADIERFMNEIRGMVSYLDLSSDRTRFPAVNDLGPIKFPMSNTQFEKYVEAMQEVTDVQKDFTKLAKQNQTGKFWQKARKYANSLYDFTKSLTVAEFSTKMPALLDKISAHPTEKHYVYSAFFASNNGGYGSQGILAIARFLESELGYEKITVAKAKEINAGLKSGRTMDELLPPGKPRYILATQKEISGKAAAAKTAGALKKAGENLHEMISLYNNEHNKYGQHVHVMLASQGFNEGIDLKGVRHIHIFEPLVTMASDKQTIGRAARYCSHGDLQYPQEWRVSIHRYMADMPNGSGSHDVDMVKKIDNIVPKSPESNKIKRRLDAIEQQLISLDKLKDKLKQTKASKAAAKKAKDVGSLQKLEKEVLKLEAAVKDASIEAKEIKKEATVLKRELKKVDAPPATKKPRTSKKKMMMLDPSQVKNVEEIVYRESRERMQELLILYQAMKNAAIDCRLLEKFHNSGGVPVKCFPFPVSTRLLEVQAEESAKRKRAEAAERKARAEQIQQERLQAKLRREQELADEQAKKDAELKAAGAEIERKERELQRKREQFERQRKVDQAFLMQKKEEERDRLMANRKKDREDDIRQWKANDEAMRNARLAAAQEKALKDHAARVQLKLPKLKA